MTLFLSSLPHCIIRLDFPPIVSNQILRPHPFFECTLFDVAFYCLLLRYLWWISHRCVQIQYSKRSWQRSDCAKKFVRWIRERIFSIHSGNNQRTGTSGMLRLGVLCRASGLECRSGDFHEPNSIPGNKLVGVLFFLAVLAPSFEVYQRFLISVCKRVICCDQVSSCDICDRGDLHFVWKVVVFTLVLVLMLISWFPFGAVAE